MLERILTYGPATTDSAKQGSLLLVVPLSIAIIFLLLFVTFGRVRQAGLVLLNVPFALKLPWLIAVFLYSLVWSVVRLAVALGWAKRPAGAGWGQVYGVAVLCGIGFTMSLFIGGLAFPDPQHETAVKLGVLAGSALSGLAGAAILLVTKCRATPH